MGTWQHKEFEKCLTKVTYTNKIQQFDFKESGKYPIISQNAEFISGYWDNDKDVFKLSKPVVIFGDHTRCLKYIDFDFVLGADGVKILQTIDEILPKYLYYYLQYIPIDNLGYSRHYKLLKEKIIKYPTIEQQQKIVEILDKADEIRAKKKLANDKLDEFLKSTFISMFGDPVRNEQKHPIQALSSLCNKITDGTHDTPPHYDSGVMIITGKNIRPFRIDYSQLDYVSEADHKIIYERCNPEYGDVLYTNIGVNLGTAVMNNLHEEFSMKNVALLKNKREILNSRFLEHILNFNTTKNEIIRISSLGGAQKFLSLQQIRNFEIIVPPIEDQNKFAKIVEHVEAQKQKNEFVIEQMKNLFNSLSQRAFKGEIK